MVARYPQHNTLRPETHERTCTYFIWHSYTYAHTCVYEYTSTPLTEPLLFCHRFYTPQHCSAQLVSALDIGLRSFPSSNASNTHPWHASCLPTYICMYIVPLRTINLTSGQFYSLHINHQLTLCMRVTSDR